MIRPGFRQDGWGFPPVNWRRVTFVVATVAAVVVVAVTAFVLASAAVINAIEGLG